MAAIILKRLDDAVAAGDPIRAIIRGTALNQDGKTPTITTPSQEAQEELMRTCYRQAGVDPAETGYVEAHGTGTPTGDPIELRAISNVIGAAGRASDASQPLLVGSVKTAIGHTEAASGLASIIKVVLGLEKGLVAPNFNFERQNDKLDLAGWNVKACQNCNSISLVRVVVCVANLPWACLDSYNRYAVALEGKCPSCFYQQLWIWRRECPRHY